MTSILIGNSLLSGRFLERNNRFICTVEIDGRETAVHLHDPGRLRELLIPGARVIVREEKSPRRKTGYDMVGIYHHDTVVSCDTRVPNRLIKKALEERALPEIQGYSTIVPEFTIGHSRLDFCLDSTILLEVKGVSLVINGRAIFPDAPTQRGRKHLETLMTAAHTGFTCYVLFLIQRPDAHSFSPNTHTDPLFSETLVKAVDEGVILLVYTSEFLGNHMYLRDRIAAVHLPGR